MSSSADRPAAGPVAGKDPLGLTVITVVKDNLEGLKKTHACLVKQTNRDFDWLVLDGLSSDGTAEWLKSLDMDRLTFKSEKDKSLFNAMNKAISMLETGYCIFLNGGDYFWDDRVADRILGAIRETRFEFAYGQYMLGGVPGFPTRVGGGERINRTWEIFYGRVPCHQASILSRRAFTEFGGYREDIGIYGDREWMLRYAKKRPPSTFVQLPFVVAYYDPHGLSYHRFFKNARTYLKMHRDHGNFFEFLLGTLGWCKTALYIYVSGFLRRRNAAAGKGDGG